jgi:hypothetical protein
MWELEDKYKDIKSRAEWAFNIAFVSVILGAGYAAWTIRYGEAHPELHIKPIFGLNLGSILHRQIPIARSGITVTQLLCVRYNTKKY